MTRGGRRQEEVNELIALLKAEFWDAHNSEKASRGDPAKLPGRGVGLRLECEYRFDNAGKDTQAGTTGGYPLAARQMGRECGRGAVESFDVRQEDDGALLMVANVWTVAPPMYDDRGKR